MLLGTYTQGTSASTAILVVCEKCVVTKTTHSIGFHNYYAYSLYGVKLNMHFDFLSREKNVALSAPSSSWGYDFTQGKEQTRKTIANRRGVAKFYTILQVGALENIIKKSEVEIIELTHIVDEPRKETRVFKENTKVQVKELNYKKEEFEELKDKERVANENETVSAAMAAQDAVGKSLRLTNLRAARLRERVEE
ncbi:hypothetical protein L1887_36803 [Cichorium endivia]|nr:hypothetical protein L1887_36803 [Cichorium endivia]